MQCKQQVRLKAKFPVTSRPSQSLPSVIAAAPSEMERRAHSAHAEIMKNAPARRMSKLQIDVAKALRAIGVECQEEFLCTASRLAVDIAVVLGGERYAVEVDGPVHFFSNHLTIRDGPTRFRDRLLRAAGWKVVPVPYFEWNCVPRSLRYAYLLRLLQDAGWGGGPSANGAAAGDLALGKAWAAEGARLAAAEQQGERGAVGPRSLDDTEAEFVPDSMSDGATNARFTLRRVVPPSYMDTLGGRGGRRALAPGMRDGGGGEDYDSDGLGLQPEPGSPPGAGDGGSGDGGAQRGGPRAGHAQRYPLHIHKQHSEGSGGGGGGYGSGGYGRPRHQGRDGWDRSSGDSGASSSGSGAPETPKLRTSARFRALQRLRPAAGGGASHAGRAGGSPRESPLRRAVSDSSGVLRQKVSEAAGREASTATAAVADGDGGGTQHHGGDDGGRGGGEEQQRRRGDGGLAEGEGGAADPAGGEAEASAATRGG